MLAVCFVFSVNAIFYNLNKLITHVFIKIVIKIRENIKITLIHHVKVSTANLYEMIIIYFSKFDLTSLSAVNLFHFGSIRAHL